MSNSNSPGSSRTQKLKGRKQKREKRSTAHEENEDDAFEEVAAENQSQGKKQKREKRSIAHEENEDDSFEEVAAENQSQDPYSEVVPYSKTEVIKREEAPATVSENVCPSRPHPRWWTLRIRKDDEFFHFVILCFAVGTLLVCYYKYNNWIVSLGIGLMTFAGLETTGIYFGLVYRIRSILEGFIPLLQRIRTPGFRKVN